MKDLLVVMIMTTGRKTENIMAGKITSQTRNKRDITVMQHG